MGKDSTRVPSEAPAHGGAGMRAALRRRRPSPRDPSFAFGARLLVAVLVAFAVVGATSYVLLNRSLANRQIIEYAAANGADAQGFETLGAGNGGPAQAMRRLDPLLDAVKHRPGVLVVTLVDPHHVVRASTADSLIATHDYDRRITAALEHGVAYAGRQAERAEDRRDFEFVDSVNLPGGRYAYEVDYSHGAFDAQLREVRAVIAVIALIALFGGGGVFYLAGGRRLMRSYRMVLGRATRDGLTDLPNQRAFQDELAPAVASAMRYGDPLALVLLDVDEFKLMNDRFGHPHGDGVLRRVAAVLGEARPGDRVYRLGDDEFALVLAHTDAEGAGILVRRIRRSLGLAGITISAGMSALRTGVQADVLRAEAVAALLEARRHGGDGSVHFDDLGDHLAVTTAEKREAVRRLTDEGRLTTDFQPIWNIGAGTMLGVEALARPDSSYQLAGPAEAFDVAEQIGRVRQLDVLCVASALRIAPELEPDVLLFINLSPSTLDLDAEEDDWLLAAAELAGLAPERIVVEVTERFGGRTESVVRCLHRLREQGFKIAIDDVGTGNSGLEMLSSIEAEFVKIDRSIVVAAATEPGARAVLMAMATFARLTGAFVIAEGIEDEDALRFLRTIDGQRHDANPVIQGGQGFGLGRPSSMIPSRTPEILCSSRSMA